MNFNDFSAAIDKLKTKLNSRDLKTYLLAIYKDLIDSQEQYLKQKPTLQLTFDILRRSITAEPAPFNIEWLNITENPFDKQDEEVPQECLSGNHTPPEVATTAEQDFNLTLEVLKFQIAELHKMHDKQLKNELRYFGIASETGSQWYNFDPYTNLSCGVAYFEDSDRDSDEIDWSFIGLLLEVGRSYE